MVTSALEHQTRGKGRAGRHCIAKVAFHDPRLFESTCQERATAEVMRKPPLNNFFLPAVTSASPNAMSSAPTSGAQTARTTSRFLDMEVSFRGVGNVG